MSLYGSNVEYGLHCLLYLADPPADGPLSSRDLAEFQGISPSLVAKLFTQLQKAGLVESAEGIQGGFRLAKAAGDITIYDVVRALEGDKPLFQCKEIRQNCILYRDRPPDWATRGVCGIHAIMLEAESRMLESLRGHTLASLAGSVDAKIPAAHDDEKRDWFAERLAGRRSARRRGGPNRPAGRPGNQPNGSETQT